MADKKTETKKPAPSELKEGELDKVSGGGQVGGGPGKNQEK